MHPDYLLEQLTSAQLSEWEAYDRLDPIGTWRDDHNTAYIISSITNLFNAMHTEEGHEVLMTTPGDFIPIWDPEERKKIAKNKESEEQRKNSQENLTKALLDFARRHNEREDLRKGPVVNPVKRRK